MFDTQGGETLLRSIAIAKKGGWVVSIGSIPHAARDGRVGLTVVGNSGLLHRRIANARRWPNRAA